MKKFLKRNIKLKQNRNHNNHLIFQLCLDEYLTDRGKKEQIQEYKCIGFSNMPKRNSAK